MCSCVELINKCDAPPPRRVPTLQQPKQIGVRNVYIFFPEAALLPSTTHVVMFSGHVFTYIFRLNLI